MMLFFRTNIFNCFYGKFQNNFGMASNINSDIYKVINDPLINLHHTDDMAMKDTIGKLVDWIYRRLNKLNSFVWRWSKTSVNWMILFVCFHSDCETEVEKLTTTLQQNPNTANKDGLDSSFCARKVFICLTFSFFLEV